MVKATAGLRPAVFFELFGRRGLGFGGLGRRFRGRKLDLLGRHGLAGAATAPTLRAILLGHRHEILELRLRDRHERAERAHRRRNEAARLLLPQNLESVALAHAAAGYWVVHEAVARQVRTLLR